MNLGKGQRKVAAWVGSPERVSFADKGEGHSLSPGKGVGTDSGKSGRRNLETVYQHRRMCKTEGCCRDKKEQCSAILKRLVLTWHYEGKVCERKVVLKEGRSLLRCCEPVWPSGKTLGW